MKSHKNVPKTGKVDLLQDPHILPSEKDEIIGLSLKEETDFSSEEYLETDFLEDFDSEPEDFDRIQFVDEFTTGIDDVCTCLPPQFYRCRVHDEEDELYGEPMTREQAFKETYGSLAIRERFGPCSSEAKLVG